MGKFSYHAEMIVGKWADLLIVLYLFIIAIDFCILIFLDLEKNDHLVV